MATASPHQTFDQASVQRMLAGSSAFQQLPAAKQDELVGALAWVAKSLSNPLAANGGGPALAGQLAPADLRSRLSPGGGGAAPAPAASPGVAPAQQPASGAPTAPSGGGPTGRVGEVARATLNAIDFPGFVAGLIQGTFQAIVDASIKQMEAYAELLKNVAGSLDRFMQDNISEGTARDYLHDQYEGYFNLEAEGGEPQLKFNRDKADSDQPLPSFFQDLGFATPDDVDDEAVEKVMVPAARRTIAETRQQTLATMVLMGINRVVVDDGEITAKLQFHIDASETTQLRFDQSKTTMGNMSGRAGRSPFTANAIMVNTTSLNAQSDINVRADLTGQVKVRFRSETFPLDRFADSAAIQLINQNARVPPPTPPAAPAPATPAAASPASPAPTAPAPVPAEPRPPVAQSLDDDEQWRPRMTT